MERSSYTALIAAMGAAISAVLYALGMCWWRSQCARSRCRSDCCGAAAVFAGARPTPEPAAAEN